MSNLLDFQRLSTYVNGIVDRKVKAISLSITNSTGYLKSLILQASNSASAALASQQAASGSAGNAASSAAAINLIWANFTSTYLGLQATDPAKSSLNNPIGNGAFAIRPSNGRLRYAVVNANGTLTWQDATVAADPATVIAISDPRYLRLNLNALQIITGSVSFSNTVSGPSVTDWASQQLTPAKDVVAAIKTETDRAKAAENTNTQAIGNNATAIAAEVTRAQNAENANAQAIATNSTAISTEKARALAAEKVNSDAIAANAGSISVNATEIANLIATYNAFIKRFGRGSNSYGSWEIRPGIIEMWGRYQGTLTKEDAASFTFPLQLPNTSYTVTSTPLISTASIYKDLWVQVIDSSRTTTSVSMFYQAATSDNENLDGFDWRIVCAVAFDYVPNENGSAATSNSGDSSGSTQGSTSGTSTSTSAPSSTADSSGGGGGTAPRPTKPVNSY